MAHVLNVIIAGMALMAASNAEERPRLRDLGREPGVFNTGPRNDITDVPGVLVGHCTVAPGANVRTGVTAILPHGGNIFQDKVPAAIYVGNGFGKAAGFLQIEELGSLETPIVLTNTLSVGIAVESLVAWTLNQVGNESVRSVNAVVGETNDGFLNDIRGQHITRDHVWAAIDSAKSGPVKEGCVGAGAGTIAFGWKGGIGTSSRLLSDELGGYSIGVLVQSNFGGVLSIDGVPVGKSLGHHPYAARSDKPSHDSDESETPSQSADGSCMIVLATDAPLSGAQLKRVAKRAIIGLGRTGSYMSHGSGDFVIAFSTSRLRSSEESEDTQESESLKDERLNPVFLAAVESTEEAIYNSLLKACDTRGFKGRRVEAIDIDQLKELFERFK